MTGLVDEVLLEAVAVAVCRHDLSDRQVHARHYKREHDY